MFALVLPASARRLALECLIVRMVRLGSICVSFHVLACSGAAVGARSSAPLADAISEQFPQASQVIVADALSEALVAEEVPLSEAGCVRDYSAPCPLGWVDVGDGGTCLAPDAYAGPCGESVDYRGLSAHEKMLAASRCGAAFPCINGCTADYSVLCPVGWSESLGICEAPADYAGPCVGKKGFASVNAVGKSKFANMCAVQWPCRQASSGACLVESRLGKLTDVEKRAVAKACGAR